MSEARRETTSFQHLGNHIASFSLIIFVYRFQNTTILPGLKATLVSMALVTLAGVKRKDYYN